MMAFHSENFGQPIAKRPRVDFHSTGISNISGQSNNGNNPVVMPSHYVEQQLNKKPIEPEKPNHILLFTVFNPHYPITCEVLHTICAPIGKVLRIVIFRKNGVQAMVEFDSLESAKTAKESLYGCDIYSGCCTLKIEYAKPTKLNVYKNDLESFDYTNPNPGKLPLLEPQTLHSGPQRTVLLKEPMSNKVQLCENNPTGVSGSCLQKVVPNHQAFLRQNQSGSPLFRTNGLSQTILPSPVNTSNHGSSNPCSVNFQSQGSVCMVYGLNPEKMNANKLFNLFCLFGNVIRIKFLKTKEGCAMVQMGDASAVERAVAHLNNVTFFNSKMQVGYSKQAFLADIQTPYILSDGSLSFQDFMGSKNNRFMNPEMASKNRIQPPTKIIHFFNTPPLLVEHDIEQLLVNHGAPLPKSTKIFPSKTDRSSSGLIEFVSENEALEAIVCCNHLPISNPDGKFPYIMKLCFSSTKNIISSVRLS